MTPEQIAIVKSTWAQAANIQEEVANTFYTKLFEIDPSTKSLFHGDMEAQGNKLMMFFTMIVGALNAIDTMVPVIQDMGRRHGRYGVQLKQYDSVGAALLDTLAHHFGDAFTAEVREAWTAAFVLLSTVMKQAQGEQA
nr:globin domain-containing protein [uncultured Undibacterium sp.]